jgi:serine phosphatase RsbU (regulator of sigma subunit)
MAADDQACRTASVAGGAIVTPVAERAVTREPIGVLLVEDDEGDARLVEDELSERLPLAKVARSRSLKDALAALGPEIDCVLLDLGLPDTSGLDAVAQLRSRAPGTPLIVLTGLDDQAAGVAAVEAGAQDYLVKGRVEGEQLARSIHYAIGRRRAEEAERGLLLAEAQAREVGRLEKGLAPSLSVEDPELWVASCYRAGRSRALLGGDFFDLVQTEDGLLHALVGDVCGHGPDEAAIGVSLRVAWRALALAGNQPQVTLRTMQRVFEHERHVQGLFATLCTIEIDPRGRTGSLIRAGHPSPMLIAGASTTALCEAIGDGAVGINRGSWEPERVTLPEDWTILLYTDGIIEGRVDGGSERLGEAAFRRLVAERIASQPDWRERPAELLDELIAEAERLNGEALSDDVAMLLVGARGQSDAA